ncbi:hypothetical protein H6F51_08075 [Cyanobacteria bacterium FACHB-DQ100]|uniref:hypothetical protein n=1 Tax=Leptolyngbya sp. DQ-M1 TaxID=2933920 RepID=UPI0019948667|nr:hypothetical protein [Cyanobacteria bacterium FACHB-DQ100]
MDFFSRNIHQTHININSNDSEHNYWVDQAWVDQAARFTPQDQTDLIQFMLSIEDDAAVKL